MDSDLFTLLNDMRKDQRTDHLALVTKVDTHFEKLTERAEQLATDLQVHKEDDAKVQQASDKVMSAIQRDLGILMGIYVNLKRIGVGALVIGTGNLLVIQVPKIFHWLHG